MDVDTRMKVEVFQNNRFVMLEPQPCEFTYDNDPFPTGTKCGREGYKPMPDGEWRCLNHVNLGYHRHNYNGVWIYEKPVDCGHPLHCKKCCCGI